MVIWKAGGRLVSRSPRLRMVRKSGGCPSSDLRGVWNPSSYQPSMWGVQKCGESKNVGCFRTNNNLGGRMECGGLNPDGRFEKCLQLCDSMRYYVILYESMWSHATVRYYGIACDVSMWCYVNLIICRHPSPGLGNRLSLFVPRRAISLHRSPLESLKGRAESDGTLRLVGKRRTHLSES